MRKKKVVFPLLILIILLLAFLIPTLYNLRSSSYEDLSELDRAVLGELNEYLAKEQNTPIWEGFRLADKPILAINGKSRQAFLINPKQELHNFLVKEIALPESFSIRVYRLSPTAPQSLRFLFSGNFNTDGQQYSVFGNSVYFTKYNDDAIAGAQSSSHYITFLAHESFHYYMQANWPKTGRFNTDSLSEDDLRLMEKEYAVLGKIYDALKQPDTSTLNALAVDYVAAVQKRIDANPKYMKEELEAETNEGSATYIGVQASKLVGYDFKIMHIDASSRGQGVIEWPFDTVVPMLRSGQLSRSAIASDLVYQSGGLLCQLLEQLQVADWQNRLNTQTKDAPVTLYSLLAEHVRSAG